MAKSKGPAKAEKLEKARGKKDNERAKGDKKEDAVMLGNYQLPPRMPVPSKAKKK